MKRGTDRCVQVLELPIRGHRSIKAVYSPEALCPSIVTNGGGNHEPKVIGGIGEKTSNRGTQYYEQNRIYDDGEVATSIPAQSSFHPYYGGDEMGKLRIRKLTPEECYRLMGFDESDSAACRAVGQSDANMFHQAGDSIVTTCLVGIFGELLGIDYKPLVEEYVDKLHGETLK